ncbi:MAG: hypothetical protein HYZ14_15375 [Bacteroidetes bacterium]|nr:hypothetical protein [Bacteroidota bacterium]
MKIDRQQLNPILSQWIKWDKDLAACLRDIQLKLLYDRIVQGMNYTDLAKTYQSTPKLIQEIFHALLLRIERHCPKQTSALLKELNAELEAAENGKRKAVQTVFEFDRIFLN